MSSVGLGAKPCASDSDFITAAGRSASEPRAPRDRWVRYRGRSSARGSLPFWRLAFPDGSQWPLTRAPLTVAGAAADLGPAPHPAFPFNPDP